MLRGWLVRLHVLTRGNPARLQESPTREDQIFGELRDDFCVNLSTGVEGDKLRQLPSEDLPGDLLHCLHCGLVVALHKGDTGVLAGIEPQVSKPHGMLSHRGCW